MPDLSLITKDYRWKATNNAGELAKFHMRLIYDIPTNTNAVAIFKLTLCNKRKPARVRGFTLMKKFKGKFLYQEHIVLKADTLFTIAATIHDGLTKIHNSLKAN